MPSIFIKNYQRFLHYYFSIRNSYPVWFGILNYPARRFLAAHPPTLSESGSRILSTLKKDGIAFTSVDELFPGKGVLQTLQAYAKNTEHTASHKLKKKFLLGYWDWQNGLEIDLENPFISLTLDEQILSIVNFYQRFATRLNYFTLEKTLPVGDSEPVQSQRWHRDPEEKRTCKIFIYLNDVDEESGPFTYVKGSAPLSGSAYASLFPQKLPLGSYPDPQQLEKAVKKEDIITATGKAGTLIFCDTAGLHRGGHAKSKPRLMFTAFYPSGWWSERKFWRYPSNTAPLHKLSPAAKHALFLS